MGSYTCHGSERLNLGEQLSEFSRELPEAKQQAVLDPVEFLTGCQARRTWTVLERQGIVANTMGCLAASHTSSAAFAERKLEEKATEDRWRKSHPTSTGSMRSGLGLLVR